MYDHLFEENLNLIKENKESLGLTDSDIAKAEVFTKIASTERPIMQPNNFADSIYRKFPINNLTNAMLSKIYFEKTASKDDQDYDVISTKIDKALNLYNINVEEMNKVLHPEYSMEKEAAETEKLALEDYALVKNGVGIYPMNNYANMEKCASYFNEHYKEMPEQIQQKYSKNFFNKLAKEPAYKNLDLEINTVMLSHMLDGDLTKNISILKTACNVQPVVDCSELNATLLHYKYDVRNDKSKDAMNKLAKLFPIETGIIRNSRSIAKIASIIDKINSHEKIKIDKKRIFSFEEITNENEVI